MSELVRPSQANLADRVPPHAFFMVSALFHYLGPSFAVLLFSHVGVLGVAWLRIASAAAIFAIWRRPWRVVIDCDQGARMLIVALGITLALMNSAFYLAIDRLPLATVAAIEFVATIAVALVGVRSLRNVAALVVAVSGVFFLIGFQWSGDRLGVLLAIANAALFGVYVVIGHAISRAGGASGIDRLGAAMLVALIAAMPIGIAEVVPALSRPELIPAGIGVGVSSSVIPYVCDQLAMARLPRATFALMLTLLPATAAVVGMVVLAQVPTPAEIAGILLVARGVGVHKPTQ
ncbi:MAG: EamA family transporter [Roseiarcus sp.]|uniref:EamA family transporter n=1 Tax=Roseiarcus sp. TaxID=1969460 RepID=UPI003BB074B0